MDKSTKYYRRNLPHFIPEGYSFFVTARLAGTIPKSVVDKLTNESNKELERINSIKNIEKRFKEYKTLQARNFLKYESYLEKEASGNNWLAQNSITRIVKETLHKYDGELYKLIAYTIMPNHIHLVLLPIVERDLSRLSLGEKKRNKSIDMNIDQHFPPLVNIMKRIKGRTARYCNLELGRTGKFWQHESFDHIIRNQSELRRIVQYVLMNPIKAGLITNYDKWQWNFINKKFLV